MIFAGIGKDAQLPVAGGREGKAGFWLLGVGSWQLGQNVSVRREMKIRTAVALGLAVKIPVFDVHAHGQAHVGIRRKLFAECPVFRRPTEMKNRRVLSHGHFRAQLDFHRAAVAGVRHKIPDSGRTGLKRHEVFEIQRREKTIGVHPDAEAFHENMAVHWHGGIEVCTERTIVFGIHAPQIHAQPRHAADAVGQQN